MLAQRARYALLCIALPACGPFLTAQNSDIPAAQTSLNCPPSVLSHQARSAAPQVELTDVKFLGAVKLSVPDQDQIAASLKGREYSGELDGLTSELEERVRRAWQEHGYFKVEVHGNVGVVTRSPEKEQIAGTFRINEGERYRLRSIIFRNNKAVGSGTLRDLFAIKDGEVFNTALITEALEKLTYSYAQLGYINFTAVPETHVDEEKRTISLRVDLDEGKQFYVSSISVVGLDDHLTRQMLSEFLQKPGEIYNQRLMELSIKRISTSYGSAVADYEKQLNESVGTVAITVHYHNCPAE